MSLRGLKKLCKDHGGFNTPSLNDKLYANYKGYTFIDREALEPFTGTYIFTVLIRHEHSTATLLLDTG